MKPKRHTGKPLQKAAGAGRRVLAPENLPYQMRLLVQLLTRRFQTVIEPFDVTPLHWGILSCLWQEDGLPTQVIAHRLEQLGGTVTVGLDSMEARGLIRREQDGDDRRVLRVWLTRKGKAMEQKLVPIVGSFVERLFSGLSAAEYAELARLVQRLREHVEGMSELEIGGKLDQA